MYSRRETLRCGQSDAISGDLFSFEEILEKALAKAGAGYLDGNGSGEDTIELFTYGPDADALEAVVAPLLKQISKLGSGSYYTKRHGGFDMPDLRFDL